MSAQRADSEVQFSANIEEFTPEEASGLFDRMAQFFLGISGDEFLRRWDEGEYSGGPEDPRVETMSMYMLLVRDKK